MLGVVWFEHGAHIMKLMVQGTLYPGYLYQGKTSNSFSLISFRRCIFARSSHIFGQLSTIMSIFLSLHEVDMTLMGCRGGLVFLAQRVINVGLRPVAGDYKGRSPLIELTNARRALCQLVLLK